MPSIYQQYKPLAEKYPDRYKIVEMNQKQEIVFNGKEEQLILTFGLGGCFAAGAVPVDKNNKPLSAMISHQDILRVIYGNGRLLEVQIRQFLEKYKNAEKIYIFLVPKGEWEIINNKWKMVPDGDNKTVVQNLENSLKQIYGDKIEIKIIPYNATINISNPASNSFYILNQPQSNLRVVVVDGVNIQKFKYKNSK